jgi:hypothetical protein
MMGKLRRRFTMKNKIALIILIAVLSIHFAAAELPGNVRITLLNQEPDPVAPWEYVDLRLKVENHGTQPVEELYVKLDSGFPLQIPASLNTEKYLGTLWGGLYGSYGVVLNYRVRLSDNAAQGPNKFNVMYRSGNGEWASVELELNVRALHDMVAVDSIAINPEIIKAGDTASILFSIQNLGGTEIKDISVKLDFTEPGIPFVPDRELSQKLLSVLRPHEIGKLAFNIRVDPNAASRLYKIPLIIEYYDALNTKFTKTDVVGLEVGGRPELFVGLEQTSIFTSGTTGDVILNIVNNGETDVKFLKVKIAEQEYFVVLDGQEQYIGNLDSDDYETVRLKMHLKSNCSCFTIPVELEYKDTLNNEYRETRHIEIPYYTRADAIKFGLVQRSNSVGILIVIVIVLGGYLMYRKHKKRKQQA